MLVRWLPLRNLISRKTLECDLKGGNPTKQPHAAQRNYAAIPRRNQNALNMRLPHLLKRAQSAILTHCGVEQLVARRAHNPEVAGSSPAPAISRGVANSNPHRKQQRRALTISILTARLSLFAQRGADMAGTRHHRLQAFAIRPLFVQCAGSLRVRSPQGRASRQERRSRTCQPSRA